MIEKQKQKELSSLFVQYKKSNLYQERLQQTSVIPVFRDIIRETLKNDPLENKHLTGLIQIMKYGPSEDTFNRYMLVNIKKDNVRDSLTARFKETGQQGFTGQGKASINKPTKKQLVIIKDFLLKAFKINSIDEAIDLCSNYESEKIPEVTKGIYSSWLHYINPKIFPIYSGRHTNLIKWLSLPDFYPEIIRNYTFLASLFKETDFSNIDRFFERFSPEWIGFDLTHFSKSVIEKFGNPWRCAVSDNWNFFSENNCLSIGWIDPNLNYTSLPDLKSLPGKMSIEKWVKSFLPGNLCFVMDRYNFYGIALAKERYQFSINDRIDPSGRKWATIPVDFIFKLDQPILHRFNIAHTNPATFFKLDNLGFSTKNTIDFLFFNLPDAFMALSNALNTIQFIKYPIHSPMTYSKNTILYGPPGTGKTYNTVDRALEILNEDIEDKDRDELKALFAHYQKAGRIYFTTFHQNMAYEDFIEGIKPASPEEDDEFLQYEVQDGLFMKACVEATFNYIESNFPEDETVDKLVDFNSLYNSLFDQLSNAGSMNLTTKSGGNVTAVPTPRGNFSITHAGSTKPYTVSRDRLSKIYELHPNPNEITNIQEAFRDAIGGCNATAYWSVLNEIASHRQQDAPIVPNNKSLSYEDKKLIVKRHWKSMDHTPIEEDNSQPFVFIIDEINRGNVAQIFGELITLIEDDKRMGKQEVIYLNLPYSKSAFAVPPNLYIIGTMNTADRSVEALDTALRRRFAFEPMMPIESKIPNEIVDGINLHQLLKAINNRLRILKDNDHTIGHAWFWHVDSFESLKEVFKMKIIPLLQEYFYNDYIKLGLVLGSNFIIAGNGEEENTFADFPDAAALRNQYQNFKTYSIKPDENDTAWTIADFISIYQM